MPRLPFSESVAETFLELLFAQRNDTNAVVHLDCLVCREELHRFVWIVDDKVLEVLVVAQLDLDAVDRP